VVGARPNFMKVAPLLRAVTPRPVRHLLVHTGQHYDASMSDAFFRDLGLPEPDAHLGVGSGSHAEQTGRLMIALEPVFARHAPDWVVVYGDVNSTLAAALVARKMGLPIAHVEAGVRSFDRDMPEEVNRVLTDQLADRCLTPGADADRNLRREGVDEARIVAVGNVMVDTLLALQPRATALGMPARLGVDGQPYAFATFHRAGNVDDPHTLAELAGALSDLAARMPVIFPVHPRTRGRLEAFGLLGALGQARLVEPLGYLETIGLVERAAVVLTDSGGLQVETTVLGVPCLTARTTTEWTETVSAGTNRLVAPRRGAILEALDQALAARRAAAPPRPPLWDGASGDRIVRLLAGASTGP
jgi:UDP-N-acetylglucosamine 2-epimerase (non-hydrolysing)